MILYDTPGVIEKKMHKLDSMMMKNVKSAAINADCVIVVVDATKIPQTVSLSCLIIRQPNFVFFFSPPEINTRCSVRLMKYWKGLGSSKASCPRCWF